MKLTMSRLATFEVLTLADRIEWDDARQLDEKVKKLIESGSCNIIFDLDAVSYVCSAGIGALVYNLSAVKKNGGDIYFISSNDYIEYMFQTLKFDVVFKGHIFPSIDEFSRQVMKGQMKA